MEKSVQSLFRTGTNCSCYFIDNGIDMRFLVNYSKERIRAATRINSQTLVKVTHRIR